MWHHQQNDIAWHASKLQIRLKFRHRREAEAKKQSLDPRVFFNAGIFEQEKAIFAIFFLDCVK